MLLNFRREARTQNLSLLPSGLCSSLVSLCLLQAGISPGAGRVTLEVPMSWVQSPLGLSEHSKSCLTSGQDQRWGNKALGCALIPCCWLEGHSGPLAAKPRGEPREESCWVALTAFPSRAVPPGTVSTPRNTILGHDLALQKHGRGSG